MVRGLRSAIVATAVTLLLGSSVSASTASFTVANNSSKKDATEKVYSYGRL